jgi:hypothetical protein
VEFLIRRILVAMVAISVAVLPATAEAIVSPLPAEVTMGDQADMPCCPSCNTQADFKSTACALKCVALAGAVLPAMTFALPYIANGSPGPVVNDMLHGLLTAPPTHPPPARLF